MEYDDDHHISKKIRQMLERRIVDPPCEPLKLEVKAVVPKTGGKIPMEGAFEDKGNGVYLGPNGVEYIRNAKGKMVQKKRSENARRNLHKA